MPCTDHDVPTPDDPVTPAADGAAQAKVPTGREDAVEILRSQERLHASVEWVSAERVRISKRVVTEKRTFTVEIRREELVVERFPAGEDDPDDGPPDEVEQPAGADTAGTAPVVELVLHEEVPEVTLRAVPTEWVLVYRDTVSGSTTVEAPVRIEQVELDPGPTDPGPGRPG